ncbi:hypothetical protein KM043_000738 [Ampulex compressa]|nr:hypothetical protein KM043_000738 [Ampulex compressa]
MANGISDFFEYLYDIINNNISCGKKFWYASDVLIKIATKISTRENNILPKLMCRRIFGIKRQANRGV